MQRRNLLAQGSNARGGVGSAGALCTLSLGCQPENLLRGFSDLAAVAEDCPRGCTHLPDAPDCELNEAAARGELNPDRVDSLQRLLITLKA